MNNEEIIHINNLEQIILEEETLACKKLSKELNDIKEMTLLLNQEIIKDNDNFSIISDNLQRTTDNVEQASDNIENASISHNNISRLKMISGIAIGSLIGGAVGGPIGFAISLKVGIIATTSSVFAGGLFGAGYNSI